MHKVSYELLISGLIPIKSRKQVVEIDCMDVTTDEIQITVRRKNNPIWGPTGFHFRTAVVVNLC